MLFHVNFSSATPVYLQLVDQVKAAAASGALRQGEALPSIRPLAEELRVNRNTVAKAYGQLESEGVIETHPGRGSVLCATPSPLRKDARRKLLIGGVDELIVRAHHLQIPPAELIGLVRQRLDAMAGRQASREAHEQETS